MTTALLVGASSGIGYELAKLFSAESFSVINLSRSECVLAGVKNYLCDLGDREQTEQTAKKIAEENAEINYFVYCAGCSMAAPLEYVDMQDVRRLFDVNFFAFVRLFQLFLPGLRHNEGTVCIIGSVASLAPIPFDGYYSASKAALDSFVFAMQSELKVKNVKVISVLPWGVRTHFTFKRKIYPPDKIGDYVTAQERAVKRLYEIEQAEGENPEKTAKRIFSHCLTPSKRFFFPSGIKAKAVSVLSSFLPRFVREKLIESKFLAE